MPPPDLSPEVLAQIRQEKLCRAYRDLFGAEEATRSEAQILVWNDLKIAGYRDAPSFVADRQGQLCPLRAAMTDGRRSLFLYLEGNVKYQPSVQQNQQ